MSAAQYGIGSNFAALINYNEPSDQTLSPKNASTLATKNGNKLLTMTNHPHSDHHNSLLTMKPSETLLPSNRCSSLSLSSTQSPTSSPVAFESTCSSSYSTNSPDCTPKHSLADPSFPLSPSQSQSNVSQLLIFPFARVSPSSNRLSPPKIHSPHTPPNSVRPFHGGLNCTAGCTLDEHSRCSCTNSPCGKELPMPSCMNKSPTASNSSCQLWAEIAQFKKILEQFKRLNVDAFEFSCLKAIALFKTRKFLVVTYIKILMNFHEIVIDHPFDVISFRYIFF